ncbi:MAG: BON domain-containing protein [Terriglobales bacterium]
MLRKANNIAIFGYLLLGLSLLWAQTPYQSTTQSVNQSINASLQKEFAKKKQWSNIQVSVDDQIATLSGTVPNLRAKLDAEQKARQTDKVNGVIDRIQVDTERVPDQQLQREISDRLVYDRMGMGQTFNSLTLKVHNGMVTVGGSVIGYASRDSAVDIIVATKGVKGIVDNVQVDPVSPNDDRIRMAAARAIYGNPQFTRYRNNPAHPIRIVVKNGRVTLEGVVDSQVDKSAAGAAVRSLAGVFGVKNELVVASGQ